jgi:hypothetical protein
MPNPTRRPPSALTLKSTGGLLRVIQSEVQVYVPGTMNQVTVTGIWDTGAEKSVITQKIVDALGLQPTGIGDNQTAGGIVKAQKYMVTFGLPPDIIIEGAEVSALPLPSHCDVLIGMDIIGLGDFSITNHNGDTCMSFRVPSMHEIDFVKNVNFIAKGTPASTIQKSTPQLGRNDLCHCGSGKKFKHCHGK